MGSIGDTIVALPSLYLIAKTFPNSNLYFLTHTLSNSKESHISTILKNMNIIKGYISYPKNLRNIKIIKKLKRDIKSLNPDMLIYLTGPRGRARAIRDMLFFKYCGIKRLVGVPYTKNLQEHQWIPNKKSYEHEGSRLLRCIKDLGEIDINNNKYWDLKLTTLEKNNVLKKIGNIKNKDSIIALSVGAKIEVKDWGVENWELLVSKIYHINKNALLLFIGGNSDFYISKKVANKWPGKKINLCGILTPRESAIVIKKANVFVSHDSGPMHLAAAVETPCVAIFSAQNKPGVWFPLGNKHQIIYHQTDCYGCNLKVCAIHNKKCITSIQVEEVMELIQNVI